MSEKIHLYFEGKKLARAALKFFRFLLKRTKGPAEAYAVLLVLKSCFEGELGLKESDFQSIIEAFEESFPKVSLDDVD
ncbi:MAG: hypothetical protein OEY30_02355 [Candidatus Bathyarchaeota archaeon]|nr:hypothetical protein [Candidatus Bathyarchaeota archaeon]